MTHANTKTVRYSLQQKQQAIEMVRAGHSISDVAKKQGIQNKRTLENWIRLQENGLLEQRKEGRRDNLSVIALHDHLLRLLPDYPAGMSVDAIVDRLHEEGVSKSSRTIQRRRRVPGPEAGGEIEDC